MKSILLITPPLVQINAPYPATAVLAVDLRRQGFVVSQADLSLELCLRLFSSDGLRRAEQILRRRFKNPTSGARAKRAITPAVRHFLRHAAACQGTVDAAVRFLQGRDPTLAHHIATRAFLPEGPRFAVLDDAPDTFDRLFGALGVDDRAKHLASLFLDDLADMIRDGIDPHFGFARYADHLATGMPAFAPLRRAVDCRSVLVGSLLDELTDSLLARHRPALIGLTVPFPGTLVGALRIARRVRQVSPRTRIALGGGYVNTELRELADPAVFDYVDFVCLDDGLAPLTRLAERVCLGRKSALVRTFTRETRKAEKRVVFHAGCAAPPAVFRAPHYADLPLDRYVALVEMLNPMHRLWSDGCWLKLPLAQGCYWHKCRFCDTALDYIGRYAPPRAEDVVDALAALRQQTGRSGFHFTDEALSPSLVRQVSERLLARGEAVTWWGNIRFEPAFTPALARLMARAGCVAVTGGLECANDRLLALMQKGVTLRGAVRACQALARAGILVHAYLIYGFPTQTAQETVDALETVRQLFATGVIQSAYWHRFALTCHSPMAADPAAFGIRLRPVRRRGPVFARNEIPYDEPGAADHAMLGAGLRRATYNYMLGVGLDAPVREWFNGRVPRPTMEPGFVKEL
jgi:radical SAM superfamily enzyme YgiQ (UPF0313 family)